MVEASHVKEEQSDEEIELSLGLSSSGRFGMDPDRNAKKLKRSSSSSNLFFPVSRASWVASGEHATLKSTSTLPVDPAPEEWLSLKERMEARKNRMEKMKSVRNGKEKDEDNGFSKKCNNKDGNGSGSGNGLTERVSSGIPTFQSQHAEVIGSRAVLTNDTKDPMLRRVLLDMPLVSTRGYGPHGTKVEGLLYRYRKRDEVRIVCVCHGNFYSPTEFVAHAGGGYVEHPLRHIVVNTSPFVL